MAWTKEQEAAINSRGQSLLLSAAAGSGKTAVLVERIIRRLLDRENPVDITELLVVTFTKAAAAEMAQRVGTALTDALAKSNDPMIERQLALLPSAHISTLHSFCQDVIRQYFYLIDLDPAYTIAGAEELNLLRRDVLEKLLLTYYEDNDMAPFLYPLADMFGTEHGDEMLIQTVSRMYDYSRSLPWPDAWLDQSADAYDIPAGAIIDDMPWCDPAKQAVCRMADEAVRQYEKIFRMMGDNPVFEPVVPALREEWQLISRISGASSWQELERAVQSVVFARLKALRNLPADDKAAWDACKDIRNSVKKMITESLQDVYFSVSAEQWLEGMRSAAPVMKGLVMVTKAFARAYREAKKEKGWIDFSDLEHFCLAVLLDPSSVPGHPVPSAAADELRNTYREVLIDEYQDTNGVQELITQLISRRNNRFMVGDIKQSIYRFRLADPTLFLQKYEQFSREEKAVERCIDLGRNFRSAPHILEAINEVFCRIMIRDAAGMTYGEREMLYAGRTAVSEKRWVGGATEAHLVLTDSDDADEQSDVQDQTAFEQECRFIAQRIAGLMKSGMLAARKDGTMEPLTYRHIVVLLRSMSGKADVLLHALEEAGVPAYAEQSGGYFAAAEVQIMLALLECIDNPEQDLPLAAVLRSPIVGLKEAGLAALRLSGEGSLWSCLPAYAETVQDETEKNRLQGFLTRLEQWRTFSRRHSVGELIQRLYQDTAYDQYVGGMPGGAVRQANLQALYERAKTYEAAGFRGVFRYLQLIHKMKDDGLDLAPAGVLGECEDVVRIMSIHKSKGLEFPVVIIADMTKQFNRQDMRNPVLLHNLLGIGLKQYDPVWRMMYPTCIWNGIAAQLSFESTAEEERVLYVAMTRARDKLILVGHSSRGAADWRRWSDGVHPGQAASYYDWVMPGIAGRAECASAGAAIAVHGDYDCKSGLWEIHIHGTAAALQADSGTVSCDPRLEQIKRGEMTGTPVPAWMNRNLSWVYAYPKAAAAPAKLSVSEIKRRHALQHDAALAEERERTVMPEDIVPQEQEDVFGAVPPWLVEEKTGFTGAVRGTILHKVMQFLDIRTHMTRQYIEEQLQRWKTDGLFTEEEAAAVYAPDVLQYCRSELGKRLAGASKVYREYSFTVLLPGGGYLPELEEDERFLVQGVVDCLFQDEKGWVLVDYKTDRLETAEAFRERYAVQLDLYRRAVEQIRNIVIRDVFVYSFHLQKAISF